MGEGVSTQDRLAALRRSGLVRDDESDPGGRIYKDPGTGEVFHSVTRILGATAPEQQQKALANWLERPWAPMERDTAARRGTAAHSGAEYLLKTANRLTRNTANRRNAWRTTDQGLERAPTAITRWALGKTHAQVPAMPWGFAGYGRGLNDWIVNNVDAIHAIEFSVRASLFPRTSIKEGQPSGFAGTADALLEIQGMAGPVIVDWKTTQRPDCPDYALAGYKCQMGAYAIGVTEQTGLKPAGACVVVARKSGPALIHTLDRAELDAAESEFVARCARYFSDIASS